MKDELYSTIWTIICMSIMTGFGGFSDQRILVLSFIVLMFNIFLIISIGLVIRAMKYGKTIKCETIWSKMVSDSILWSRRQDIFIVTGFLILSVFYSNTILLAILTCLAIATGYKYISHVGSNYNDDFQSPDGFT